MAQNKRIDAGNKAEGSPLNSFSTAHLALIGTVLSLISGVAGAAISGYFNRGAEQAKAGGALELERLKFETSLILKALDTPAQPDAVKRLKFFANAGLIPRYEKRVLALAEENEGAGSQHGNDPYVESVALHALQLVPQRDRHRSRRLLAVVVVANHHLLRLSVALWLSYFYAFFRLRRSDISETLPRILRGASRQCAASSNMNDR